MRAVILAGGEGTRLKPYTTVLPKPLMPVANYPVAEILLRQLRHYGISDITFAVGYLHQLIEAYFGTGQEWGVNIDYLREARPLGTAGPLATLAPAAEPVLVLNGDILCDLDFSQLYRHHLNSGNDITIASYTKNVTVDLGVLEVDDRGNLLDYIEKPEYSFQVSMGVYVFSPLALDFIPSGERLDFPDLVRQLLEVGRPIGAYPFAGLWLDIGRREDYQIATDVFEANRARLLPERDLSRCRGVGVAGSEPGV